MTDTTLEPTSPLISTEDLKKLHAIASQASQLLGGNPLTDEQFKLAIEPYQLGTRHYHNANHAEDMTFMSEPECAQFGKDINNPEAALRLQPVITLAGLYHDTVYTHVDGKTTSAIAEILDKYTTFDSENKQYTLKTEDAVAPEDREVFKIVTQLFERKKANGELLQPGDPIPKPGEGPFQNEFLSAFVAADQLHEMGHQSNTIAQVVTLIEGTIPFRHEDYFQEQLQRLEKVNEALGLGMSDSEINHTIKASVFLANKDVIGFAGGNEPKDLTEQAREYLRGGWRLIPEVPENKFVTPDQNYPPADFRKAMRGNLTFATEILVLPDKKIFHAYDHYPPPEKLAELRTREDKIRAVTKMYYEAKTVSAAIVEAVTKAEGVDPEGKATLREMVHLNEESLHSRASTTAALNPSSPNAVEMNEVQQAAYTILHEGRKDHPVFDRSDSPIAAYIMREMGPEGIDKLFQIFKENFPAKSKDVPEPPENPAPFLAQVREEMGTAFNPIADALASTAMKMNRPERAAAIEELKVTGVEREFPERATIRFSHLSRLVKNTPISDVGR